MHFEESIPQDDCAQHDESKDSSDCMDPVPNITLTVIFKCIGVTKENRCQELLALAKQKKKKTVVRRFPSSLRNQAIPKILMP